MVIVLLVGGVPVEDISNVLHEVVLLQCSVRWGCWVVPVVIRVCHPLQVKWFPGVRGEPAAQSGDGDNRWLEWGWLYG